jgi:hypothetical protein
MSDAHVSGGKVPELPFVGPAWAAIGLDVGGFLVSVGEMVVRTGVVNMDEGGARKRRFKTYKVISDVGEMEQYGRGVHQDDGSDLARYYGIFQKVRRNDGSISSRRWFLAPSPTHPGTGIMGGTHECATNTKFSNPW